MFGFDNSIHNPYQLRQEIGREQISTHEDAYGRQLVPRPLARSSNNG